MTAAATYNRLRLRDAIRLAAKVLPSKPITHQSHLGRAVIIQGSSIFAVGDFESAMVECAPTTGTLEVQVTANDLLARLDASAEEEVSLSHEPNRLTVKAKKSKWTLPTVALEMQPKRITADALESVDAAAFRRALEAVSAAMGTDPASPQYYGVSLAPGGRVLTTDGRRCHVFTGGPTVSEPTTITPPFAKLLAGLKDDTILMQVGKDIVAQVDGAVFSHRQIGVPFAPVDRIIEQTLRILKDCKVASVTAVALVGAVDAAALAAEHGQVSVAVVDGMLMATGRKSGDVSHCELSGSLHPINMNGAYLTAAAKAFGVDAVDIHTASDDRFPILLTAAGTPPGGDCVMISPTIA